MTASGFVVAAARMGPLALCLPVGGWSVRGVLGLALALGVAAAMPDAPLQQFVYKELQIAIIPLLLVEAGIGLALGLCASVPLQAARAAGLLVDAGLQPGLARRASEQTFARLYGALALLAFALVPGPAILVDGVGRSYEALPVGRVPVGPVAVIEAVAILVAGALELAAPVLAAMMIAEIAVGLVARAGPALSRHLAAAPGGSGARIAAALFAVAASATGAAVWLGGGMRGLADDLARAARLLSGA